MEKILIVRFKCECGKRYAKKSTALHHEKVCKCWSNPKNKTCKTCVFGSLVTDSNGMEAEPHHLQTWTQRHCSHECSHLYEKVSQPATREITDLRVNCSMHQKNIT